MNLTEHIPALLVVDVQLGFDDLTYWGGQRNNPQAEANIARLLQLFRGLNAPVIHVRHASTNPLSPLRPDQPGHRPKPEAEALPGERVFIKNVNSAFIGTDLEAYLRAQAIHTLVVVGVQTDYCVSTTVRMAANLGFSVSVVDDATWTYDHRHPDGELLDAALVHKVNIASLNEEFAKVVTTEQLSTTLATREVAQARSGA